MKISRPIRDYIAKIAPRVINCHQFTASMFFRRKERDRRLQPLQRSVQFAQMVADMRRTALPYTRSQEVKIYDMVAFFMLSNPGVVIHSGVVVSKKPDRVIAECSFPGRVDFTRITDAMRRKYPLVLYLFPYDLVKASYPAYKKLGLFDLSTEPPQ